VGTRLYVGGLPFSMGDEALKAMIENKCGAGTVESARVICDRETGKSRGFGFVEVNPDAKKKALELSGTDYEGRNIKVDEAEERSGGGGRSGGFNRPRRDSRDSGYSSSDSSSYGGGGGGGYRVGRDDNY